MTFKPLLKSITSSSSSSSSESIFVSLLNWTIESSPVKSSTSSSSSSMVKGSLYLFFFSFLTTGSSKIIIPSSSSELVSIVTLSIPSKPMSWTFFFSVSLLSSTFISSSSTFCLTSATFLSVISSILDLFLLFSLCSASSRRNADRSIVFDVSIFFPSIFLKLNKLHKSLYVYVCVCDKATLFFPSHNKNGGLIGGSVSLDWLMMCWCLVSELNFKKARVENRKIFSFPPVFWNYIISFYMLGYIQYTIYLGGRGYLPLLLLLLIWCCCCVSDVKLLNTSTTTTKKHIYHQQKRFKFFFGQLSNFKNRKNQKNRDENEIDLTDETERCVQKTNRQSVS